MKPLLITIIFLISSVAFGQQYFPGGAAQTWKSAVPNVGSLPASGNTIGDIRVETTAFGIYVWNGAAWVLDSGGGGGGTVTSVSVASANGLAGTVATATTTPTITLSTTVNGIVKGNGTSLSAAVSNTDYQAPLSTSGAPANQFATGFTAPNTFTYAQPDFSNLSGTASIGQGGTGQVTANAAFNALSPMTTLGDLIYEDATPKAVRLAGNTTAVKQFLNQTGTGAISAAPTWSSLVSADIPNLDFSKITTGIVPVAQGGTNSSTALNNNRIIVSSGGAIVENAAITANKALASNASGIPVASATTDTELGFLSGVTSSVQTQLNNKLFNTDGLYSLKNTADPTKVQAWDLSGQTTGTTTTFASLSSQNESVRLQPLVDATGNFVVQNGTSGQVFIGANSTIGGSNSGIQYSDATTANRGQIKLHSYFAGPSIAGVSTLTSRSGTVGVNNAVVAGQDYSKWTAQAGATTVGSAPISGTFAFKANTVNALTVTSDFHIQLTNLAGTLGDRFYLGSEGALQLPFYGLGIGHFDASGNLTSSAVNLASADVSGVLPTSNGGTNHGNFTAGSIPFAGAGGTSLTENNAKLSWDDATFRAYIGTNSTASPGDNGQLNIENTGGTDHNLNLVNRGSNNALEIQTEQANTIEVGVAANVAAGGAAMTFERARGTINAKTQMKAGDVYGGLFFQGYTGAAFTGYGAAIAAVATEDITATNSGGQLVFNTSANGTNTAGVTRMSIAQNGVVNISNLTASLPVQTDASKNLVSSAINLSGSQVTSTLPIGNGGTGQTTALAAFNALSPLTTKGDILASSGANNIRLPVGTDGFILSADSTQASGLKWVSTGGGVTNVTASAPLASSGGATPDISFQAQNNNLVLAGPNGGGPLAPTFRALVAADIPALPYASSTLTNAHIFVGNAGNVATDVAASGDVTLANTGAFTIANTAVTNAKIANGTIDLTTKVTGILPVANGGTNSSAALNNNRVMESIGGAVVEAAAITANRALISDASGLPVASSVSDATLAFLDATSSVQTQLNGKQATLSTSGAVANQFVTGFTAPNTFTRAQPAFTDISGTIATTQLPNAVGVSTQAGNYTVLVTDELILGDATGGSITLTLPASAASFSGGRSKLFTFIKKDSSANTVSISAAGADTIQGVATLTLNKQYQSISVITDGTGAFYVK